MPLYEYKCDNCGEVFEVRQKFSDEPLTVHEKCGGPAHRLLSVPALQFKGSGWYVTDYGRGNSGKSSNGPAKTSGESSSSGESKSPSDSSSSSPSKSDTKS